MSATIFWRPLPTNHKRVPASSPSAFLATCEEVFGTQSPVLAEKHLPELLAMAAVDGRTSDNPWAYLAKQVQRYGEISVWAEY